MGRGRWMASAALVLVLAAAAFGGAKDDGEARASEPDTRTLTVRVTADQAGLGCTRSTAMSGLTIGNDTRLTVSDEEGTVVGTGTFHLSPGLVEGVDTCDWTAEAVEVDTSAGYYTLDAGGELGTFSRQELESTSWASELRITVTGDVVAG